ncbi:acetoin utilization protein acuB [Flavobacterium sp. NKUCC04_CG]|uniref:acetoin utilization protein acuB n=1 Tax=Flavobacterium sp. NKUCC04_CG TaxID=2842121 RepID=UPI001C5B8A2C|nr:acetoin utilization protein acuB [Flavobacterium sp. NKUCC04_CG]MBW3518201.1 acetoin utilization protein acuB [Flavobacterium sp. NKUCC04_CG]
MNDVIKPTLCQQPPFEFQTSIEAATLFMKLHSLSHYAIVEQGIYKGNVLLEDLLEMDSSEKLEVLRHDLDLFFTTENANSFDILEICSKNDSNMVPIIDNQKAYLGYFHFSDLIDFFSTAPFFSEKGVSLTIEKNSQKYSFSEITQIVESNYSRLLGVFISKIDNEMTEIILKINSENINEVIQAFRRHDYEVLSKHLEDEYTTELQERSNYLNKYLNL